MKLNEQTQQVTQTFIASQPEEVQKEIQASFAQLLASDAGDTAPRDGDKAIDFTLPNATGGKTSLFEKLRHGPVVLSFYRGGWCPYCNLEFKALNDILPQIQALGAALIGVSPELPDTTLDTVARHQLQFEVLSDVGNEVADAYGLVMTVTEEMRPNYIQWGIDVPKANGDDSYRLPLPATYVIDSDGTIRAHFINKDYTQRMEPDDIIAALQALQR